MKTVLLPLAVSALLALPALAQPGPGVAPAPQEKPAATAPQGAPGPGIAADAAAETPVRPASGSRVAVGEVKPVVEKPYDEAADAKAVVAAAVAQAKKEKKQVLVTLGANWCGWCRSLDRTFTKDEKVAAAIAKSYVPVKVDVGRMTKNLDLAATWGADPKKGVPLLVVLDGSGKAVKVQDTEPLEAGKGHDPAKVIAFLDANAGR
jgi:thiol-disulfide isomerase/thioredoxin